MNFAEIKLNKIEQDKLTLNLIIKNTTKENFYTTENLKCETFWNLYSPGCSEHLVLHNLHKSKSYIEELYFITVYNGVIVGHIISTKAKVIDKENRENDVICIGPFSVSPKLQSKGIGTKLLDYSIEKARI